jgi:hypothetical protein
MAKSRILTGPRAKVLINGKLVGLFTNVTWSIRQEKIPTHIIGRFNPAEIVPVSQDAVQLSLTGYRVIDGGPYKVMNATLLKNLLNEEDFSLAILDRQTGKSIFSVVGCRVLGWSSGVNARAISDIRIDVMGIRAEDEYGTAQGGDDETNSAANVDDGA